MNEIKRKMSNAMIVILPPNGAMGSQDFEKSLQLRQNFRALVM